MEAQSLHLFSTKLHHKDRKIQSFDSQTALSHLKINSCFGTFERVLNTRKKLPIFAIHCTSSSSRIGAEEDTKVVKVEKKKLGIFVSGSGSNLRSIHQAILHGDVNGDIDVLVTNKPAAETLAIGEGLERAVVSGWTNI